MLGPAKLSGNEKSTNHLEEHPLGSIATAPQYPLTILSNDSQLVTNEHQGCNEEPKLVSDGHHAAIEDEEFESEQVISVTQVHMNQKGLGEPKDADMQGRELVESKQNGDDQSNKEADLASGENNACSGQEMVDNKLIISSSKVDVKKKESHEPTLTELHVSEPSEAENAEKDSTPSWSNVTSIASNVTVETFPLRPVTRIGDLDGSLNQLTNMTNTFVEQDLKKVELADDIGSSQTERIDSFENCSLVDEKEVTKLDKKSGSVDDEVVDKHRDPQLGSSKSSNEGTGHESQDFKDEKIKTSSNDVILVTLEKSGAIAGAKVSFVQTCFLA